MTGTSGSGGIGEGIRNVVGKVHGTGEAIRGKTLAALDDASGDRTTAAKNEAIANKGVDEFQHGYQGRARDAGVTPADTDAAHLGTTHSTTTTHGTGVGHGSTNVGTHSTNVGNKLDPRFDSDADHRANPLSSTSGTGAGSTNVGTHSTNVGNKVDPRFDSDADHRANPGSAVGGQGHVYLFPPPQPQYVEDVDGAGDEPQPFRWPQHEHRGSIGGGSGLEPANKLDPQTSRWPQHEYRGSIGGGSGLEPANKFDPLYEPGQLSMHYSALSNIHQHRGSVGGDSGLHPAEKFDPPVTAVRGPGFTQAEPMYHQPIASRQSTTTLGILEPVSDSSEEDDPGHRSSTHMSPQYSDRFERQSHFPDKIEPDMYIEPDYACRRKSCSAHDTKPLYRRADYQRKASNPRGEVKRKSSDSTARSGRSRGSESNEPRSTANPHKNDFLNILDPRVDRAQVRRNEREREKERANEREQVRRDQADERERGPDDYE